MFWKRKKLIKIEESLITQEAILKLGYNWPEGCTKRAVKFSFCEPLIGYILDPNNMTFLGCTNKYVWEN